ncbi:hypothetical protein, partial [Caulobacter sp. D4A]|uniref:hypothetical protein n=1 Tax=Caulobacter sp. D4A TaxID=2204171 RepID=UPI001E5440DF
GVLSSSASRFRKSLGPRFRGDFTVLGGWGMRSRPSATSPNLHLHRRPFLASIRKTSLFDEGRS